jgi:hypothetical protein
MHLLSVSYNTSPNLSHLWPQSIPGHRHVDYRCTIRRHPCCKISSGEDIPTIKQSSASYSNQFHMAKLTTAVGNRACTQTARGYCCNENSHYRAAFCAYVGGWCPLLISLTGLESSLYGNFLLLSRYRTCCNVLLLIAYPLVGPTNWHHDGVCTLRCFHAPRRHDP